MMIEERNSWVKSIMQYYGIIVHTPILMPNLSFNLGDYVWALWHIDPKSLPQIQKTYHTEHSFLKSILAHLNAMWKFTANLVFLIMFIIFMIKKQTKTKHCQLKLFWSMNIFVQFNSSLRLPVVHSYLMTWFGLFNCYGW